MNTSKILKKQLFLHSKGWLIVSIITITILSIYNIVVSWLLQKTIDIAAGIDQTPLSAVVLIAVVSFIVFIIAYSLYRTARPRYIRAAMCQYKDYVFERVLDKQLSSFSMDHSGKLLSALTNDMHPVEDFYLDSILSIVDISVGFVGALAMMIWYSPALTVAALLLSALPIVVSLPGTRKLAEKEKLVSDKNADYVEIIRDILSGFSVIKSFQIEKEIHNRFLQHSENIEQAKFERRYADENVNLLSTAASVIMRLRVFMIGAWLAVSESSVTPGIVLVFLQLVSFVIYPIERFPSILANRKAAIAIMDKLADLIDETRNPMGGNVSCTMNRCIYLKNLSFSYEGEKKILQDVTARFEAGKKYAIVGASGSGKTTLMNLIMRTYDSYDGYIEYDGVDVKSVTPESVFRVVSLVQQNVFVFNDTIYNNITLYKHFSEKAVQKAMKQAGLANFLCTHSRDYVCGENGNKLSGGEKQRISIARALLRNTSVLLMDEATAALDEITANEILSTVLSMEEITGIVVTHRLDERSLKRFDEILVLRDGKLQETGTFDNLLQNRGYFYSLYQIAK